MRRNICCWIFNGSFIILSFLIFYIQTFFKFPFMSSDGEALHHRLHLALMTLGFFFWHQPVSETLARQLCWGGTNVTAGERRGLIYIRGDSRRNCTRRGTVGRRRWARACRCQLASGLEAGRRRQEESPSEARCGRRLWTKGRQRSREHLPLYVSIALVPSTSIFLILHRPSLHFIFQPWGQLRPSSSTLESEKCGRPQTWVILNSIFLRTHTRQSVQNTKPHTCCLSEHFHSNDSNFWVVLPQNHASQVCTYWKRQDYLNCYVFFYFSNGKNSKDDSLSPHKSSAHFDVHAASAVAQTTWAS